jgi:hypothetical protein
MRRALDRRRDMSAVGNSFLLTAEAGVPNRVMVIGPKTKACDEKFKTFL